MNDLHPPSWSEPPAARTERWHTEARARDNAYLALGSVDDTEYREAPYYFGEMETRLGVDGECCEDQEDCPHWPNGYGPSEDAIGEATTSA